MRTAGSPKLLEKRRLDAIALFEDGMAQVAIAKKLRIHDRTVRRWIASYRKDGHKGVAAKPAPGRPPKLTAGQQDTLAKLLDKGAAANGYSTELWTCPRVARMVEKRFGISYHVDHMGRLLKSMGFTPQKPERRARERDEAGIRRWVRRDWSDVKKKPTA